MRRNETIKGTGTVTSSSGEHAKVKYEIHITREDAYGETIPLPSRDGWVNPVCFFGVQTLTLALKDGRTAKFIYQNDSGAIHVNWIGQE
jgi:hypothetical protein